MNSRLLTRILMLFCTTVFVLAVEIAQAQPTTAEDGAQKTATEVPDSNDDSKKNDKKGDNKKSKPKNEDFKPGEEISEDYPVSLPSDI